jgi:DNA ligase-associated metallophosphoesterase
MIVQIAGEELELLPQRAIWWKSQKIMLVSDMHLGKVNHFRKSGIPVPVKANSKNWETLIELVQTKKPDRLICIGDLFHSHYNFDWEQVGIFTGSFQYLSVELVIGNHDILSDQLYAKNRIQLHKEEICIVPFLLTHIPPEEINGDYYVLSGHVHPGVQLIGKGKQHMTLPCFYFGERQGFLPAFGAFTGLARLVPRKEDQVFVIAENSIIALH